MFGRKSKKYNEKQPIGKANIIVVVAIVVSAAGLWLWQFHWPTWTVELKGQELEVLVAKTIKHQYQGLGGRKALEPHDGMFFVFPFREKQGIVMRDMHFAIDIVWLAGGAVVDIAPNVQPEPGTPEEELTPYYPRLEANYVLELPAGWAEEHGLRIGDRLRVIED